MPTRWTSPPGLAKNDALERLLFDAINQARRDYQRNLDYRQRGREDSKLIVSHYADDLYAAESWSQKERVVARIIVGLKGVDVRDIVVSFYRAEAKYPYNTVYCQRSHAELFIKECKLGLGSDRSSRHRAESNQFRLLLHVAAYVMLYGFRETALEGTKWECATFDEIRLRVLKVACRLEVLKTRVKFLIQANR